MIGKSKTKTKGREPVPDVKPGKINAEDLGKFSLEDRLELEELNKGIIRIDDEIDSYTATEVDRKIDHLIDNGVKTINFYITSGGGSAYHSMALYDKVTGLKEYGIKTIGVVQGLAASAAAMIFLQAVEQRIATSNSRFLLHEPRRWTFLLRERTSDMQDETKEMTTLTEIVFGILAKRCKKSKEEIAKVINRREVWLSAREARDFGLIDKII